MSALAALIFDFDGTLAETERDGHRLAYNAAFEEVGAAWRWDAETYGELLAIAGGKERLEQYIAREHAHIAAAERTALVPLLHEIKARHFASLADTLPFRPGVVRLVREARAAGLRCAIATTAHPRGVDALLRRDPDVAEAFEVIGAGDVVAEKKPAPDIYRWTLAHLGLAADACLAIEDSAIGLRSARAAGLATLVTPSAYNARESFVGAAAIVEGLGEPDAPTTARAGPQPPGGIVDVAYLRDLHRLSHTDRERARD